MKKKIGEKEIEEPRECLLIFCMDLSIGATEKGNT